MDKNNDSLKKKDNIEYNKKDKDTELPMNEKSKKIIAPFSSFLKTFSIVITLFLIMSYISNKYIPGLFMNYIPMFLPVGKLFCRDLKFVSIFHSPLDEYENNTSNKFFEKEKIVINESNKTEATYYKLLSFGSSLINTLKGGFMNLELSPELYKNIPECKVYLLEEKKICWYHKIIVCIFGAIQMFIGPILTFFGAFAYLFSDNVGYFLNAVKMKQKAKNEKGEELFMGMNNQIKKENPYELLFKKSSSKFNTFFNYLNFIPVDKLSYGASYFLQKDPAPNKTWYFFLILFIIITYTQFKKSQSVGWLIPIIIGIFVFYCKYNPEPFADFKAFQNINFDGKENPEPINLNTYAEKRDELKKDILQKMAEYIKEVKQKRNDLISEK